MSMESIYEYGSRVGVWRILREFERAACRSPCSAWHGAAALPRADAAFMELGHEIANHGWRWIHHQHMPEATEREHIAHRHQCIARADRRRSGRSGWYTGRDSPNTRRLVVDHGGFEYDSDYYGDDLPFWMRVSKSDGTQAPHLVVPYTLDTNDMRFVQPQGFNTGDHFFHYLRDSFDALYAEGDERPPKMMSIGMHCRLLGRPGPHRRAAALPRPRRSARPGLGLPPHRHRAALEAGASVRPATAFVWELKMTHADAGTTQRRHAGRIRRAAGRHLRTLAVGRRARPGAAARSLSLAR